MTYEFEYLISLIGVAALGQPFHKPQREISLENLLEKASSQSVYALAASALKPLLKTLDGNQSKEIRKRLISILVAEENGVDEVWKIIKRFNDEGIPFAILKGFTLAALYKTPELRESGDVDFFVGKKYEKRAITLLREEGVSIINRNPSQHESSGYHQIIGPIEVHAYLFREEDRKVWFGRSSQYCDEIDPFVYQEISTNRMVPVLSIQNNVEFLCLHFIKHFIREGISLRNIVDLGLFIEKNSVMIDFDKLWTLLKSLKYDGVIQAVMNICVSFWGMDKRKFKGYIQLKEDVVHDFLEDVENGGAFGKDDIINRHESARFYEKVVYSQMAKNTKGVYWKKKRVFLERIYGVMYNKEKLQKRFKYAKNHEFLLPVAWIHHLIISMKKLIKIKYNEKRETDKPVNSRVELFSKLDLID